MILRALLLLGCLSLAALGAAPPGKDHGKKANRLARASSPYLLQHAHNPVDWHPWSEEAFQRAKKEGKLVFLSIGYSACHWCHVMEKESFANEEVARILNAHFICIKVDREERPDVDQIYMTALNVQGQSGGWPLSMFLDAQGRPIVGGTYWPREDREENGKVYAGFKTLLERMRELHEKEPKQIEAAAERLARSTTAALEGLSRGVALIDIDQKLVDSVVNDLGEEFDKVHGGFGNATRKFRGPKFPLPSALKLLQAEARRTKSKELAGMVERTLDQMARGGIYDHLGGGFARYSVERTWTIPHFEKMLYDNAQLLEVYAQAYRDSASPQFRQVLRETIDWVAREMTSPEGAFYSALDADSEGEEGRFYVWTPNELTRALPDRSERDLLKKAYGAAGEPRFEEKYHILHRVGTLTALAEEAKLPEAQVEARLAAARQKLFAIRAKRPRPFLDTKVLTAWNGQMIAGLARAGQALKDPASVEAARKAARFVLTTLRTKEGRLLRSYAAVPGEKPQARFNAYLDDYAYLVHGLLTLHAVTGEKNWLDEARALTDTMIRYHGDEKGGFYYTSSDHEKFFARAKDQYDGAQPGANSIAARNLVVLAGLTGQKEYGARAEKTFRALAPALKANPSSQAALAEALSLWLAK
ncbi:MAG: thioredoxin domain-containing protein [Gemmataceae bacterium]